MVTHHWFSRDGPNVVVPLVTIPGNRPANPALLKPGLIQTRKEGRLDIRMRAGGRERRKKRTEKLRSDQAIFERSEQPGYL